MSHQRIPFRSRVLVCSNRLVPRRTHHLPGWAFLVFSLLQIDLALVSSTTRNLHVLETARLMGNMTSFDTTTLNPDPHGEPQGFNLLDGWAWHNLIRHHVIIIIINRWQGREGGQEEEGESNKRQIHVVEKRNFLPLPPLSPRFSGKTNNQFNITGKIII